MSDRPLASRRRFLAAAAIGCAGAAALFAAPLPLASRLARAAWIERRLATALRALVGADAAAASLLAPPGFSSARAAEHLLGASSLYATLRRLTSPEALRERLDAGARHDFGDGRTLACGGWILSETEVAAAVLVARPAAPA